jgi:plastocyanin
MIIVMGSMISKILIISVTIILVSLSYRNADLKFGGNISEEIYAQTSQVQDANQQGSFEVTIPRGAANPEVDITNLSPRQWYVPNTASISQGNTVTWINKDTEPHTVTSGTGAGIESLMTNKQGRPNGIFDSGLFGSGESWSYNFTEAGRYTYFCTIHPWMEGVITVALKQGVAQKQQVEIPTYPVNGSGSRIDSFPIYKFTNDNKYEIGLTWNPSVIVVGDPVNFLINSFDWPSNKKSHLVPYDLVIMRDGTEIDRISDIFEIGADVQKVVFDKPGPVTIRIENVGDTPANTEFSTLVYENPKEPQGGAANSGIISEQTRFLSPLTLVYITYVIIAGIPVAVAVIIILYRRGKI